MRDGATPGFLSHAFTDLMASLAVIFIFLSVVFIHNASKKRENDKKEIRSSLEEVLEKNKLPLRQDPNDPLVLSLSVGEDVLKFSLNSAALSPAGERFIDELFPALTEQLCAPRLISKIDSIVIEGHTDRSGEMSSDGTRKNIRLSQSRSFAVLDRALQALQKDSILSECFLKLSSTTGRGSRVPVEIDSVYNSEKSRRVEVKIRVKSAEQELARNLRAKFGR